MLSLEQQIKNLADAAFDATEPITIPSTSSRSNTRLRLLAVAAAIFVGIAATAVFVDSRNGTEVIAAADQPGATLELSDPLNIEIEEVVESSPQERITRLGPATIVDTTVLDGFDAETDFLFAYSGPEGYEYWQQTFVTTPGRIDLVVNVYGTETAWPAETDIRGDEVTVRDRAGRISNGRLTWLETDQVRVEILGGPVVGVADITDESLSLAEALTFVERSDAWSLGDADRLGFEVDGDPILAGMLGGVEWDVVESDGELIARTGTPRRFVFDVTAFDTVTYAAGPLPDAGGTLIVGIAPADTDRIEVILADDTRIALPTVSLSDGLEGFAVPIDDRVDPVEIQLLSDSGEVHRSLDLRQLPPYSGETATVSIN